MQYSRRKSGLKHAVYFLRTVTCLCVVAAGAIVTLKLGFITPGVANTVYGAAYGAAVATAIFLLYLERTDRVDAMADVQYDVAEINAGAQSLDDLGVNPMTPPVMKKFEWTVTVVIRGVVLFNDLAEWHHEHRAAAWWGATVGLVAGLAAAATLIVYGVRFEPVTWSCLAVAALLPLIAALLSRNELPPSVLGTPEKVASCIFCVIMRLSEGKMAVKNAMISMVDKGVDCGSALLERKIANWMAGFDLPATSASTCGCGRPQVGPAVADRPQPVCTCGQHQTPHCPTCQKPLV